MTRAVIPIDIRIQHQDFDIGAESKRVAAVSPDPGAIVTFTGLCRHEDGKLAALELEHYPGMAEAEIGRIAESAAARWPVSAITVIHRYGRIAPGENIVLVITASTHRHAAFDAANFLMDFLKTRAPFWKKEHPLGATAGGWVSAKEDDDLAAERWREK